MATPVGLTSGATGGTVASLTTAAFTPRANSTLYVFAGCQGTAGGTFTITDSVGLTWTLMTSSTGADMEARLWGAPVGGSPVSMTVTLDPLNTVFIGHAVFDVENTATLVTGQKASASQSTGTPTPSGTLPASATSGNYAIVIHSLNDDNASGVPLPSGFTNVITTGGSGSFFHPVRVSYSTTFTGTNVTVTQDETGLPSVGAIFELESSGADGSVAAVTATGTAQAIAPAVSGATVEYVSQGAAVAGTTSITTAAYGTGWAAGDLGVCVVASNHATTEATEPTVDGFTKIGTLNGGGGSQGVGSGNRRLTFFTRELQAGDDTTPAIGLATGNVMIAAITILRKRSGYTWDAAVSAFGAETTAGTSWSEAMTTDPGFAAEDMLVAACAVRDTSDSSAEGFAATGATFASLVERIDLSSETGNDIALHVATAPVLTGPSSAAGTRTATHSTSETGVMGVLRVRAANSGAANVNAVAATSTATAAAPTISNSSSVTATAATSTLAAAAPTVAGVTAVTAAAATATMQVIAPAVSATQNPTVVAVAATSTAQAPAPTVSASSTATAVASTATASAVAPVVTGGTGSSDGTVVAVAATSTAAAAAPSVGGEGAVQSGGPATATMQAHAPTVTGIRNATVAAATLLATAAALAPVVSGSGSVNVSSVVATASAAAVAPAVSASSTVAATSAAGTAAAIAPAVSGSVVVTVPTATATATAHAPNVDPGVGITDPGPRVAYTPRENRVAYTPRENRAAHVAREPRYIGGD